jgi:hypothetical protein
MKKLLMGGAGVLWKFVIGPSVAVTAQNSLGTGWNDAKPDLSAQFSSAFSTDWAMFNLDTAKIQELSNCCADKAVAFLNSIDCSYLYNQATTSETEHLKKQEACMTKVKYDEAETKFSIDCLREHFPNDWQHLKPPLNQGYEASFIENGVSVADAKKLAVCIAEGCVTLANDRKCPVVNKSATIYENLVNDIDTCIKDPENDPEFQKILKDCDVTGTPENAPSNSESQAT